MRSACSCAASAAWLIWMLLMLLRRSPGRRDAAAAAGGWVGAREARAGEASHDTSNACVGTPCQQSHVLPQAGPAPSPTRASQAHAPAPPKHCIATSGWRVGSWPRMPALGSCSGGGGRGDCLGWRLPPTMALAGPWPPPALPRQACCGQRGYAHRHPGHPPTQVWQRADAKGGAQHAVLLQEPTLLRQM